MKKIAYILSTVTLALGAVACSETKDDNPVLIPQPETGGYQDFLNIPEYADQYLSLNKETADGTVNFTCSQPDYGFAAAATYAVEVSFSQFPTTPVEGDGSSIVLATTFHDCGAINVPNAELADAIMAMLGIESPDDVPTPYYPLYVRLIAQIYNGSTLVPNTTVYSNTVTLKGVSLGYIPAVEAGLPTGIYLRGGMNGWGTSNEFLTTTEAGVYIISDMEIGEGVEFKVATEDWGTINAGTNGSPLQINVPYYMEHSSNSGNITCPSDFMGDVQLVVKGGNYILTLIPYEEQEAGVPANLYLVGDLPFGNWSFEDAYRFKTTKYVGNWILENVEVPAGRQFKIAAAGWGDPNCGLLAGAADFAIGVPYTLWNDGASGNLEMPENFQGNVALRLRDGSYIVTFTQNAQ